MAAMTLTEARAAVRQVLDSSTSRWSDANIDSALRTALSAALGQYVSNGGDRLREVIDVSSDANGEVDLSSYDPFEITGVSYVVDNTRVPVGRVSAVARGYAVQEVKTLSIELVRAFTIPASASNALVYSASADAAAIVDPSFEQLVVLWAALDLSLKDRDQRPEVQAAADRYASAMFTRAPTARAGSFSRSRNVSTRPLQFFYIPGSRTLGLCRAGSLAG